MMMTGLEAVAMYLSRTPITCDPAVVWRLPLSRVHFLHPLSGRSVNLCTLERKHGLRQLATI